MGLQLTGKGSIWDAIGNVVNTGANAAVAGVKDIGDLFNYDVASLTGNDEAAQNATNAIHRNNANLTGENFGQNLGGLVTDVTGSLDQPINTVGAGVAGLEGLAGYGWNSAFGTPEQANNWITGAQNQANWWLNHGRNNKGGLITADEANSSDPTAIEKGIIKGVADVAPYVIGAPEIEGASPLVERIVGGATNFGVGAGATAAGQYADTGKVDVKEAIKQGTTNAAIATGTDLALGGLRKGEANLKENIKPVYADETPVNEDLSALHAQNPNAPIEPVNTSSEPTATPADLANAERAAAAIDQQQASSGIDYTKVEGAGKALQQAVETKAEELRAYDKSVKGGQLIPDGEGGYKRTTEHSPFYSKYYAENGKAPTKAAYRDYAEQLLRRGSDEESANYHNLSKHAEAEQELKAYQQADKQSGYTKVRARDIPKGESAGLPTPVIEKISSPEYQAKADAGRFLQRIRDELPTLEDQMKVIESERKRLAKAKDLEGMRELSSKTADIQLRYRQLKNMERQQAGEYTRTKAALDDKFPDTMLYQNGKRPRGAGTVRVSNVPVRGGSTELTPRESGYSTQKQYDTSSITPSDITTSDKVMANTTGESAEQIAAKRLGKPQTGTLRISNAETPAPASTTPEAPVKGDLMTPQSYEKVFGVPMETGVHIDEQGSSYSPEFDHSISEVPQQKARSLPGDTAAFEALRGGKTMDEAVAAYQEAAGATKAEAEKAVNRVAETGLDMGTYEDVLKRNPAYNQLADFPVHDMSDVSAKVDSTGRVLNHLQDRLNSEAAGLSEGDMALLDQLRGHDPQELAPKADNPEQFTRVAAAAKDISDYNHEIRRMNGDDTIYRQNYGAGMHYANATPEEMAAVSGYRSDLASKPGFSQERHIGDYGEAESKYNLTRKNANFLEDVAHDSRQTIYYVRERAALRSISELYGKDSVAYGAPTFEAPKQLNGLKDVFASKEVAKKWNDLHPQAESALSKILWKPYDAASSAVVQATVANPAIHGSNQFTQGFIAAGKMHGPEGGGAFIKNQIMDAETANAIDARRFQVGDHNRDYGKNNNGIISKMTHGVTDLNKRAMSALDTNMRRSLFKTLTDDGMTDREAVKVADKFMGDTKAVGNATRRFTFFFHYFKTMLGALAEQGRHPIANAGTITNAAIAAGTVWAINSVLQQATGNKDAHIHNPGELGIINEGIHSGENIAKGHYKDALQIATNRIHPFIREGAQQLFNQDLFTGKKISETGRPGHAVSGVVPEANLAGRVNSDSKSAAEAVANFLGVFTPHAKGYQAAPNIPALNTSTTDATGKVVPAKKGTGTDQQQAYFDTSEQAKSSLPAARQAVYDSIMKGETDDQGNPIGRNEQQAQAHYADLAGNPDILKALTKQKQLYAAKTGTAIDPLYSPDITDEQRQKFLHMQALSYKSDDFIQQEAANPWVKQLNIDRAAYFKTQDFSGAPPSQRVTPPQFDPQTEADMTTATTLEGPEKATFIKNHPNLQAAYDAIGKYTNDKRVAEGNAPLKLFPHADPDTQKVLTEYAALPKGNGPKGGSPDRAIWIQNHPAEYAKMQNYLASLSEYELANSAGQDRFEGAVPSQAELKAAYSLGKYDINKTTDASGKVMYSIDPVKAYQSNQNSTAFNPNNAAANRTAAFERNSRRFYSHAGKHGGGIYLHTNSQNRRVLDRTKLRVGKVTVKPPKTGKLRIKSATIA